MQRMQAVYHGDDSPGDQWKSACGIGAAFHLGLQTSKGHVKDKYTRKAMMYKHALASGIKCQLIQVCLHVPV